MWFKFCGGVAIGWALANGVHAAILPGNFLPNPSVEDDEDFDGIPDGWLLGGNDPSGDIWDDSNPVSGTRNLFLLDTGDSNYTSWYTTVDIPTDAEELQFQWTWLYELTSDNPSDEFRMSIAWRSEGTDIAYNHVVVRDDQPEYVTEEYFFDVPPDADAIRLEFVTAGPGLETGYMSVDDISIAVPGSFLPGDFNGDQAVDAADIDLLTVAVLENSTDLLYDANGDLTVNDDDRVFWVDEIKRTYVGDSDLDGEFNSTDMVTVFQEGEYEDDQPENSTWGSGDWNGDLEFDSGDFVTAFQAGGYEIGPRQAVQAVPEPAGGLIFGLASMLLAVRRRR